MGRNNSLSDREKQVLRQIAQGNTDKEIANALQLSPKTVATHRLNIRKKTGIRTSEQLTVYAIRHGIIDIHNESEEVFVAGDFVTWKYGEGSLVWAVPATILSAILQTCANTGRVSYKIESVEVMPPDEIEVTSCSNYLCLETVPGKWPSRHFRKIRAS